jgi:hypothetical protein
VFDESLEIESILLCAADPRNVQYLGPALLVIGFKGASHLVLVNTLTFETIYQIHVGSGPPLDFVYGARTRIDFDEELNVLVVASEDRASIVTVAVRPPHSFFGNNSGKRLGLLFSNLLKSLADFDTFETTSIDCWSEMPVDGGSVLSFVLLSVDGLSLFCVQRAGINQFVLPSDIVRSKGKIVGKNTGIVTPSPPASPGGFKKREKRASEVSVSFAELNAGVNGAFDEEEEEFEVDDVSDKRPSRVSFSDLSVQISETASETSSRAQGSVTFDDEVDVVADSSASVPDILKDSAHATIVVDELEKKRRDSDSVVTDEIYLFRNLVHEIHKMEGKISENVEGMVEKIVKREMSGIGKGIEDRIVKSMAVQSERIVEKVVPKLLGKAGFVGACAKGVVDSVGPAVEGMFASMFRDVFMPGMQKAVGGMFVQIHEGLETGFKESFEGKGGRDDSGLLKSLEEKVGEAARASEHSMNAMFSKTVGEMNNGLRDTIGTEIRKVVAQEISSALAGSARGHVPMLKTPSTPVLPELDYKILLERDIENKDYETAFTKVWAGR